MKKMEQGVKSDKSILFEVMKPSKALAIMAFPTVASQMILLLYNLADTWFIGRTGNPYMIGASSLAFTVYMIATALANVFGTGGGTLMARLIGKEENEEARKVVSYSLVAAFLGAFVLAVSAFVFMDPLLKELGASENTLYYAKQYVLMTTVFGGIPTVLSMCMPQLLRNAGYSKEAGIGVALGSLINIGLDPLFMFVLLPEGQEVLGAGIATMLSSVCSVIYFVVVYHRLQGKTVLVLPRRLEEISSEQKRSLYSVGVPSAIAIFLFDLVTIVINKLASSYGDIPLAAMGIVLKLERIPINIGLGVCLGMVPLIAYNYGAGNRERIRQFLILSGTVIVGFSCLCVFLFQLFAEPTVGIFISDVDTIGFGVRFLKVRCLALPFMMIGYLFVNYMNAVDRGKISFLLILLRHVVLIIPIMFLMNRMLGLRGLLWSQLVADCLNVVIAGGVFGAFLRDKGNS